MKKFVIIILALFCFGFQKLNAQPDPKTEKWYISDPAVVKKLKDERMKCTTPKCHVPEVIINWNVAERHRLVKTYSDGRWEWVKARYYVDEQNNYSINRGLSDPDAGKVSGYKTRILKVTRTVRSAHGFTDETNYFDIVTLCPPPEGEPCPTLKIKKTKSQSKKGKS